MTLHFKQTDVETIFVYMNTHMGKALAFFQKFQAGASL